MSEGVKVWVVTYGEYSDTHVVAVCSDQVEAERLAGLTDTGDVQEFVLDEVAHRPRTGSRYYEVRMDAHGNVEIAQERYYCKLQPADSDACWNPTVASLAHPYHRAYRRLLVVSCWADSKEHAVKIANDLRAQALANGAWEMAKADLQRKFEAALAGHQAHGYDYPYTHEFIDD